MSETEKTQNNTSPEPEPELTPVVVAAPDTNPEEPTEPEKTKESKSWWYTELNKIKNLIKDKPWLVSNKIILVYDCDQKRVNESFQNLQIIWLDKQEKWQYEDWIENYLILENIIDINDYIYTETNIFGKKTISETKLKKLELCKYICEKLDIENQKIVFSNFKYIYDQIV